MSLLDGQSPQAIAQAADALAAGQCVGLPTETVYGLAANAQDAAAVARIYSAKGRPASHPLIVHLGNAAAVPRFARDVPAFAQRLMEAFWPGPLTLILPRQPGVAEAAAGGQDSVGLRCPAHPVAQALLAACAQRGVHGLAAPSANRFGRVSPTTAAHVAAEFGPDLLVLDGGPCAVGIESSIVDCTRGAPVLLRPGQIARADLDRVAGQPLRQPGDLPAAQPRAPGTLAAHYAPNAKLRLMSAADLRAALEVLGPDARHIGVWARAAMPRSGARLSPMPASASEAARALFATLRDFDAAGLRLIWVEVPPEDDPAWDGVRDRLQRAAAAG